MAGALATPSAEAGEIKKAPEPEAGGDASFSGAGGTAEDETPDSADGCQRRMSALPARPADERFWPLLVASNNSNARLPSALETAARLVQAERKIERGVRLGKDLCSLLRYDEALARKSKERFLPQMRFQEKSD